MSETKYKLCKRAGLTIWNDAAWGDPSKQFNADMITAASVETLLAGAPVVYASCRRGPIENWITWETEKQRDAVPRTHTARLLMIEPIKPKSLEDKILEVLDDHSKSATEALTAIRRLLEGK